jgi:chromosome segregation ATPase
MEATRAEETLEPLRQWLREGETLTTRLVEAVDQLDRERERAQQECENLRRQLNEARGERDELRRETDRLHARIETVEGERDQLIELRTENEDLRLEQDKWFALTRSMTETLRLMNETIERLQQPVRRNAAVTPARPPTPGPETPPPVAPPAERTRSFWRRS